MRHGDDIARAGLHEGDRCSALTGILGWDVRRHRLHGGALNVGVECCADGQAAAAEERLSLDERLTKSLVCLDHADDEVTEVRRVGRRTAVGLDGWIEDAFDGHSAGRTRLDRRDETGLRHLSEDEIAPLLGEFRIAGRVEGGGLLDDAGQCCAFDEVQICGWL